MNKDRYERILLELVECYGEGASTDWAYLNDLAELIDDMIERETNPTSKEPFQP